jgi:hypothetical protein
MCLPSAIGPRPQAPMIRIALCLAIHHQGVVHLIGGSVRKINNPLGGLKMLERSSAQSRAGVQNESFYVFHPEGGNLW